MPFSIQFYQHRHNFRNENTTELYDFGANFFFPSRYSSRTLDVTELLGTAYGMDKTTDIGKLAVELHDGGVGIPDSNVITQTICPAQNSA